jgi:hypothetical protein
MRAGCFLLRLCALVLIGLVVLLWPPASAHAHARHEAGTVASPQTEALSLCGMQILDRSCTFAVHAAEATSLSMASGCGNDGCCATQVHCCPVLMIELPMAGGPHRHVAPIVRGERAEGLAPGGPDEPPNAVPSWSRRETRDM